MAPLLADGTSLTYDLVHVGSGNINGTEGSELIYGGSSNDTLSGRGGIDLLFGSDGSDTLNGDAGDDVFAADFLFQQ